MRVLVCGARGCIGRAVVQSLRWRGHRVVEGVRQACDAPPAEGAIAIDFMRPTTPQAWAATLIELRIDAVVNCVGIALPSPDASFERVHAAGPIELFRGAAAAGVGRVVQVSAIGVGASTGGLDEPASLRSKRLADEALLALDIDAAVVRPSLVHGPGSESARRFASLARSPVVCLPGSGEQPVQPIHVFEVAEAIAALVERTGCARGVYELGGGAVVSYRDMLAAYRRAQGLGHDPIWLRLPLPLVRLATRVAEHLTQQALGHDTLRLLPGGSVTTRNAAQVLLGREPTSLADGLAVTPPRFPIAPAAANAPRWSPLHCSPH